MVQAQSLRPPPHPARRARVDVQPSRSTPNRKWAASRAASDLPRRTSRRRGSAPAEPRLRGIGRPRGPSTENEARTALRQAGLPRSRARRATAELAVPSGASGRLDLDHERHVAPGKAEDRRRASGSAASSRRGQLGDRAPRRPGRACDARGRGRRPALRRASSGRRTRRPAYPSADRALERLDRVLGRLQRAAAMGDDDRAAAPTSRRAAPARRRARRAASGRRPGTRRRTSGTTSRRPRRARRPRAARGRSAPPPSRAGGRRADRAARRPPPRAATRPSIPGPTKPSGRRDRRDLGATRASRPGPRSGRSPSARSCGRVRRPTIPPGAIGAEDGERAARGRGAAPRSNVPPRSRRAPGLDAAVTLAELEARSSWRSRRTRRRGAETRGRGPGTNVGRPRNAVGREHRNGARPVDGRDELACPGSSKPGSTRNRPSDRATRAPARRMRRDREVDVGRRADDARRARGRAAAPSPAPTSRRADTNWLVSFESSARSEPPRSGPRTVMRQPRASGDARPEAGQGVGQRRERPRAEARSARQRDRRRASSPRARGGSAPARRPPRCARPRARSARDRWASSRRCDRRPGRSRRRARPSAAMKSRHVLAERRRGEHDPFPASASTASARRISLLPDGTGATKQAPANSEGVTSRSIVRL